MDTILMRFFAPWCSPCKAMAPALESALKSFVNIKLENVNIDQDPNRAAVMNVRSIPTLILIKNGETIGRLVGAHSQEEIEAFLSS